MENSEIKVILSERGKELANVGAFKYRFIGFIKKGELLKWRCTKNNCTAMIYSGPNKNIVIQSSGQHYHVGNSPGKLERQVLRENCKRRAEESLSTQPLKLIRNELLNNLELSSIVHKDLKTVRKAMYDKRRKILPKLPKSPEDVFLQLNLMKTQDDFKFHGQPFIHIPDDNSFVCITCDFNLKFMIEHDSIDFFADGTFNYAPKYFEQLYSIHGYKNGYYLPLVYFFLFKKSNPYFIPV
uniref:FLYWCH-type domain-containing protein n=1 Tax=Schizaphis graminum TaxID=13262 RepID=A0A2S2NCJ0_SCHGA